VKALKLLDYGVEELAGKGFTPLLPFYIIKLRKEAKRLTVSNAVGRVCKAPFSDTKARSEGRLGYAGAERIRLCQKSLPLPYIALFDLLCGIIQLYIAI
jgi:hypothetical protein